MTLTPSITVTIIVISENQVKKVMKLDNCSIEFLVSNDALTYLSTLID